MNQDTRIREQLEFGFYVGPYLVEPMLQRISTSKGAVRVEPKVMEVLVLLAEHQGKPVNRDRFMDEVWNGTIVTGDALLRCISELRKVFEDDPREPSYIETIRKRGYRLVAPVVPVSTAPPATVSVDGDSGYTAHDSGELPVLGTPGDHLSKATALPVELKPSRTVNPLYTMIGLVIIGLLVVSIVLLVQARRDDLPAIEPIQTVPLTSYPGEETDPALSPDGMKVAFSWNPNGQNHFDIFVKQIGVETPQQLTTHEGDEKYPAWSPDGQFVAFIRTAGGYYSINIVPAVGGSERKVLTLGKREARSISWSPDGRTLALSVQAKPHGPFGTVLLDLETLRQKVLTRPPDDYQGDLMVAFSPDGQMVAVVRSVVENVDDLFVVPTTGGELKRVTNDRSEITGLSWAVSGDTIVYSSDRVGSPSLWKVPLSAGPPIWIPVSGELNNLYQPTISRSGKRLVFVQRQQETNIWQYHIGVADSISTDTTITGPFISSTRWDSNPAYSPDGNRIAFISNRTGSYEVWTCDRDGANPVQVTELGGTFTNSPRWSPDGRRIAFVTHTQGSADIYLVSADIGKPTRFTTADANDQAPSWSRDGKWIYFASNRSGTWQIWKKSINGGTAIQVTQHGGFAASEAPDGQFLYFVKRQASGIWRMPIQGGPEELILPTIEPFDWGNWAIGDQGIYYLKRDQDSVYVHLYHPDTRAEDSLLTVQRIPHYPSFAVSPLGDEVLVTQIDRIDSDMLLVDEFE